MAKYWHSIVWTLAIVLGSSGLVFAVFGHKHIKALESEVTSLKNELGAAKEQLSLLALRSAAHARRESISEAQNPYHPVLDLDAEAVDFIRSTIVVPPAQLGARPIITVGTKVSRGTLMKMPDVIADKFPALKRMMVTTDRSGSIALVRAESSRVEFVILPR